jgi:hypothetical protein
VELGKAVRARAEDAKVRKKGFETGSAGVHCGASRWQRHLPSGECARRTTAFTSAASKLIFQSTAVTDRRYNDEWNEPIIYWQAVPAPTWPDEVSRPSVTLPEAWSVPDWPPAFDAAQRGKAWRIKNDSLETKSFANLTCPNRARCERKASREWAS